MLDEVAVEDVGGVPIGDAPVVADPVEDEDIGPEPARELENSMKEANVEDVIEAEKLEEESG